MQKKIMKFSPDRYSYLVKNKGLKKKEVAERAGFKPSELSRYLSGQTEPQGPRLEALAKAIEVNVADITEEVYGAIYCSLIELEFTTSGLKSISRDGVVSWTSNIEHIRKETSVGRHTFELPDLFCPGFLRYIADGMNRDHPARSISDVAAAELLAKAAKDSRRSVSEEQ